VSNKSNRDRPTGGPTSNRMPKKATGSESHSARAPATGARAKLERYSVRPLTAMHAMPRAVVPIGLAAFLFAGLILTGTYTWLGGVLLTIVTIFIAWLTALSWPLLTPASKLIRLVICFGLIGITVLKSLGRF